MLFRYDVGEKLDLAKFKKQAKYHLSNVRDMTYEFYLTNYKLKVDIGRATATSDYIADISLFDLKRDAQLEITNETVILPNQDYRFSDIEYIQNLYQTNNWRGEFSTYNVDDAIEKIYNIIKLLFKIDNFKCFV
jgi:hypothetical protein